MKLVILSKDPIESFEQNLSNFLADDLVESIQSRSSIVVLDLQILPEIKRDHPEFKFEYHIEIRKPNVN